MKLSQLMFKLGTIGLEHGDVEVHINSTFHAKDSPDPGKFRGADAPIYSAYAVRKSEEDGGKIVAVIRT